MDTLSIWKALSKEKCFLGVYPCDLLPDITRTPAAVIINTDPSNKPGEHWVAVYFNENNEAEYFDSFGLPPLKKEILSFLNKFSVRWYYNPHNLQPFYSSTCGLYCIMFLRLRCRGYNFCTIIHLLTKNRHVNDIIVRSIK